MLFRDNVTAPPLWQAAYNGDLGEVQRLVSEGANCYKPNTSNNSRDTCCTPLHIACYRGHTKVVRFLLSDATFFEDPTVPHGHHPAVYIPDTDGVFPLSYAMEGLHIKIAKLLLAHGAVVNPTTFVTRNSYNRDPPVLKASNAKLPLEDDIFRGHNALTTRREWADRRVEMMKLLFSHGAHLPRPCSMGVGYSLWENALGCNQSNEDHKPHTGMLHLLVEYDRGRIPLPGEWTPVHIVASLNYWESRHGIDVVMLEILARHGYNLESTYGAYRTPLHVACEQQKPAFVKFLLDAGVDLYGAHFMDVDHFGDGECWDLIQNQYCIGLRAAFAPKIHLPEEVVDNLFLHVRDRDYY
jgi:ankyrin repeat protein